jgi:hypothetical protein
MKRSEGSRVLVSVLFATIGGFLWLLFVKIIVLHGFSAVDP